MIMPVGLTPTHVTKDHLDGGVVFDCDGVLANTTACWDDAFRHVADNLGLTLDQEQLTDLHGAALLTGAESLVRWSSRPAALDDVIDMVRDRLAASIDAVELVLIDGVQQLLHDLHGSVPLGVASNSPRAVLHRILMRLDISGYFAVAISADDVRRPKPAPDPYLAACDALHVAPRSSLAIEDSEIGVRSATAAGLRVVELTQPSSRRPLNRSSGDSSLRVTSLADHRIRTLALGLTAKSELSQGIDRRGTAGEEDQGVGPGPGGSAEPLGGGPARAVPTTNDRS